MLASLILAGVLAVPPAPLQCTLPGYYAPAVMKTVVTTRAPVGHTHTCLNGHTWDHTANPTHTCQFCGATQFVQDRVARPVMVKKTVQAVVAIPEPPATVKIPIIFRSIQFQAGGCANGQCSTIARIR